MDVLEDVPLFPHDDLRLFQPAALMRDTATATTFTLPRKVTIRSDGAPHRVKVASLEVAARLRYACVPSRDSGFWMTARITNTSEFLLLPGPLAAFIDGQLAHQSRIGAAVNPGETFRQELAKHEEPEEPADIAKHGRDCRARGAYEARRVGRPGGVRDARGA